MPQRATPASADAARPLAGRTALVTGGGRGIGRATALLLAGLGAAVVVVDRGTSLDGLGEDAEPANAVAREIVAAGGRAIASAVSVTDAAALERLTAEIHTRLGSLDLLVCSAGLSAHAAIWETDPALFERVLASHATGTFNAIRCAVPYMRLAGRGRIVTLVSRAGLVGSAGAAAYAAGKGAIFALTNVAARDLAPLGITVNAVNPAATDTRMVRAALERAGASGDAAARAGRLRAALQEPDEVARLIAALCLDDAAGITGQVFLAARGRIGLFAPLAVDREAVPEAPTLDAVRSALRTLRPSPLDEPY